jgi:hypothetical protein
MLGELPRTADLVNVLRKFPGRSSSRGDLFPLTHAKPAASKLGKKLDGRAVVLLGRSVADAFDVYTPFFQFGTVRRWRSGRRRGEPKLVVEWSFQAIVLPHPSGVNRAWNAPEIRDAARAILRAILEPKADRPKLWTADPWA